MINLIQTLIASIKEREEGQTLAEYALILFFVAIVAIAAVTALGVNVANIIQSVADAL